VISYLLVPLYADLPPGQTQPGAVSPHLAIPHIGASLSCASLSGGNFRLLNRLLGESTIDCISNEVLFPGGRYASIAGGMNPKQPELILQACKAMPEGSGVVSVTHSDPEGERCAEVIREMATEAFLPL
jgi:hypothetical protein